MSSRLNPDDQKRVEHYLSAPQHQVERQPFKVWRLLLIIVVVVIALGVLSRLLSRLVL
jgi:cytoskeletal protein RodZ